MIPATAERPADDADLARRIGLRDERAFETMMRRHNRMLYRIARSILKDDGEAEDAVQEAYLSAFRNIGAYRGESALGTWLGRMVINESYARLRKRRAAIVVPLDPNERDLAHAGEESMDGTKSDIDGGGESPAPEAAAMRAELRALLERKIDRLPAQFRTVFMLREVEELSVEETAQLLELPPATVRTRAFRARALLRAALAEELDAATLGTFGFDGRRCDRIVAAVLERMRAIGTAGASASPEPRRDNAGGSTFGDRP